MGGVAAAVWECKAGPCSECSGLQYAVLGALPAAAFRAHTGHISIPTRLSCRLKQWRKGS